MLASMCIFSVEASGNLDSAWPSSNRGNHATVYHTFSTSNLFTPKHLIYTAYSNNDIGPFFGVELVENECTKPGKDCFDVSFLQENGINPMNYIYCLQSDMITRDEQDRIYPTDHFDSGNYQNYLYARVNDSRINTEYIEVYFQKPWNATWGCTIKVYIYPFIQLGSAPANA